MSYSGNYEADRYDAERSDTLDDDEVQCEDCGVVLDAYNDEFMTIEETVKSGPCKGMNLSTEYCMDCWEKREEDAE